jgi:hypothetical protein
VRGVKKTPAHDGETHEQLWQAVQIVGKAEVCRQPVVWLELSLPEIARYANDAALAARARER